MWSPEFRLALQASRHALGQPDIPPDYPAVDWDRFLILVRRHRIQGLVYHALVQLQAPIPEAVAERLARDADMIVSGNLHAASACNRIDRAFRDAGLPLLFIKGLTLASLAYSNPFLKMSWDIDVLVDPRSIEPASQILTGLGYRLVIPRGQVVQWHRHRKESVWQGPNGTTLELHGRLADNRALIPSITFASPSQSVAIQDGIVLPTLGPDELFAYLCVHGASSAWFRLKWPMDLAALLSPLSAAQISALYERSQSLGAGRSAGQALMLANQLYAISLPKDLIGVLQGDRWVRALVQIARKQMAGRMELREPTKVPLGTASIHLSQLLLLPGLPYKARETARQARDIMTNAKAGVAWGKIGKPASGSSAAAS